MFTDLPGSNYPVATTSEETLNRFWPSGARLEAVTVRAGESVAGYQRLRRCVDVRTADLSSEAMAQVMPSLYVYFGCAQDTAVVRVMDVLCPRSIASRARIDWNSDFCAVAGEMQPIVPETALALL